MVEDIPVDKLLVQSIVIIIRVAVTLARKRYTVRKQATKVIIVLSIRKFGIECVNCFQMWRLKSPVFVLFL